MDELANCEQQSAGVFYVLISTDKYGFRPLPQRIPQNKLEELRSKMDDLEKDLMNKFYLLDTNALKDGHPAPEYVMLTQPEIGKLVDPSTDDEGATKLFWSNMPKVVEAFRAAAIQVWSPMTVEAELNRSQRWAVSLFRNPI